MNTANNVEQNSQKESLTRRRLLMGSSFLLGYAASSATSSLINANAQPISQEVKETELAGEYLSKETIEDQQQTKQRQTSGFYHVGLFAADLDATIRFYTEAFGLTIKYSWKQTKAIEPTSTGEFFMFPFRIELLDFGDGSYLEVFDVGKPPNELVGDYRLPVNHFALRVPDIDATYARAIAAGAKPYDFSVNGLKWDGQPLNFTISSNPPVTLRIAFVLGPNSEIIELATLPDNGLL